MIVEIVENCMLKSSSLYGNGGFPFDSINETKNPIFEPLIEYVQMLCLNAEYMGLVCLFLGNLYFMIKKEGDESALFFAVFKHKYVVATFH